MGSKRLQKAARLSHLRRRIPMLEQQLTVWSAEERISRDREVLKMTAVIHAQLEGLRTELTAWETME